MKRTRLNATTELVRTTDYKGKETHYVVISTTRENSIAINIRKTIYDQLKPFTKEEDNENII